MGPGAAIALVVIAAGALLGAGGLLFAGLLMGLVLALRSVWSRYGLRSLEYERHLSADRVPWGERIDLDLVVRNGKPLPLPWLQIEDTVTHGAEIVGRSLSPSTQQGFDVLRQTWSIGWFERVTRRLQIVEHAGGVPVHVRRAAGRRSLREHRPTGRADPGDVIPGGASDRAGAIQPREQPARNGARRRTACTRIRRSSRACAPTSRATRCAGSTGRRRPASGSREPPLRPRPRAGRADRGRHADPAGRLVAAQLGRRPGRRPVRRGAVVRALVHRGRDRRRPRDQCLQRSSAADRLSAATARRPDRSRRSPTGLPMSARSRRCRSSGCSPMSRARAPLGCSIMALSGRDPVGFLPTLRRTRAQGYLATLAAFGPRPP